MSTNSWLAAVLVCLILGCSYACEKWKYDECRKVGHGKLYCLMNVGEHR